jgi:hypothetical protein
VPLLPNCRLIPKAAVPAPPTPSLAWASASRWFIHSAHLHHHNTNHNVCSRSYRTFRRSIRRFRFEATGPIRSRCRGQPSQAVSLGRRVSSICAQWNWSDETARQRTVDAWFGCWECGAHHRGFAAYMERDDGGNIRPTLTNVQHSPHRCQEQAMARR